MAIQLLPSQVADQIAAGEGVGRPASVVKELLENAIDGQAQEIEIRVEEGGLRSIQVIDDGIGIASDEVALAFKRHATSKIHQSQDLFRIHSLGFRGEALPSIASVSEMTLETSDGQTGTWIYLQAGELVDRRDSHLRQGTSVLVENLFYNTPARLKYIKSLPTELSHISNIINRQALGHPQIRFRYFNEDKLVFESNGKGRLQEVLAAVYGFKQAREMYPIEAESLDFKLTGYVSPPTLTRASKNYISLYLNGRYIRNYKLSQAVIDGYREKLMIGRYPIAVLHIEADPQLLDVNVHPTKMEVRISKEDVLYDLIKESLDHIFQPLQRIPEANQPLQYTEEAKAEPFRLEESYEQGQLPLSSSRSQVPSRRPSQLSELVSSTNSSWEEAERPSENASLDSEDSPSQAQPASSETIQPSIEERQHKHSEKEVWRDVDRITSIDAKQVDQSPSFPDLDYIGQLHGTYLLASDDTGMYLLDQHAMQERIKYEYYRDHIGTYGTAMQELLIPELFEFTQDEMLEIQPLLPKLKEMQLDFELFGSQTLQLSAHPTWIRSDQVHETVEELIQLALTDKSASVSKFRQATAIMMSCKLSIKANHYLSDDQAKQLIADLSQCQNPFNCAHGRPVLIHYSTYEIERLFKRIQDSH
ncbi:DNA mismatch repair endonuclease MutL [Aerococcus sanguinicola]|uniref:DNA mismatch repair endonuclease MutL n=1 Tax=Aerococcus sanguinicola TaxID=119206 RepID=UPI0018A79D3E|nr:DNA mismatch repair endonuclease MutL [Aerococcus sanguinicola]